MIRLHHFVSFVLVMICLTPSVVGQYVFSSKKAEKLYNKLEGYYNDYDYDGILKNEANINSYWENKGDTLTALMYNFLGEAYFYGTSDIQTGLDYYYKEYELRSIHVAAGMDHDLNDLIYNLAAINLEAGKFSEAEKLYADLLESDEEKYGSKSDEYVSSLLAFADYYTQTGESDKGKDLLRKNRSSIKKGTFNQAMALRFLADYQEIDGEFSKAEDNLKESLNILNETGYYPSLEYVYVTGALGILYTNKGQYPLAMEVFDQAISIFDRLGNTEDDATRSTIEFNLGQVYIELGQYPQAIDIYKRVLASDIEIYGDDSFYAATTKFTLGQIYTESEEFSKAEELLIAAEETLRMIGEEESPEYARTLSQLYRMYNASENTNKAIEFGDKALAKYEGIYGKDHHAYARMLSNKAEVHMKLGELDQADDYLLDARKIRAKELGTRHPQYALSSGKLAVLNWEREEQEKALEFYNEVFDNYFAQINSYFPVLSEDEKSKFYYNKLRPTFEQFNSFIMENRSDDKSLLSTMYNYQLSTKGLILYATNKVKQSILNSGDSTLIEKYETWIGQKEQLAKLFSAGDMNADARTRKIDSLLSVSNDLEGQLSKLSSAFAGTFASRDLTWKDVQAKLKPGEAAIEMIRFRDFDPAKGGGFTDEVYYAALIVTKENTESPEIVIMRNGAEMERKYLANYRNAIRYKVNENHSYRLFWRPIANKLQGIKKIYFSPDGVYNQISVYTLQNPASKKFTIDEFEIQLVTNTKDLVAFNFEKTTDFSNPSYLFGYPNYNMGGIEEKSEEDGGGERGIGGERGARGSRGSRGNAEFEEMTRSGALPRGIRGNLLRYMRSSAGMPLLPGTQKEVNLINDLHKDKTETIVFMDDKAVEDRIKEVKNPQTLHIATHGFFLELGNEDDGTGTKDKYVENPLLRSGLIMAGANSYIKNGSIAGDEPVEDDGILTAYEAMNLNLDETELVVMSACETGLGEIKNGEGVFGLQRAFQVAGAKAIIMSMWTVDDNATQELMTNFYEEWLATGDKHQSFISAQKRLKEKWKYPYYWGAFVMIGN
ncbi:MAG: CHAT domain-containing protein [Cyclobacteriaceae bacterium]